MEPIRIVIHGVLGKMGQAMTSGLLRYPDLKIVGGVDRLATQNFLSAIDRIPLSTDLDSLLSKHPADVVVDFSLADASMPAARVAIAHGVRPVIGTTGLSAGDLEEIDRLARAKNIGAMVAPNFAVGAVVQMYLAKIASRFFDYAEIIELHHEAKADSPSGTALSTAKGMLEARGKPFIHPETKREVLPGTRGGETGGISIHSVRLPGFTASQEVIFGDLGQTLSLRHDSISRESFVPGVVLAIRKVIQYNGLIYGLDRLMDLEGRQ